MFILSELEDTVTTLPRFFSDKINKSISFSLNKKFSNKVVHNLGLCIGLWDILKINENFIFPGDGSAHTLVRFRYVIFRPFIDEILVGKIKSSSSEGLVVTLGFFDDILISSDSMPNPTKFIEAEQTWAWEYKTNEEQHDLVLEIGEEIRFKVIDEIFVDNTPTGPETSTENLVANNSLKPSYTIIGSISDSGLGLLSWWAES